jgi:hypothetical protein
MDEQPGHEGEQRHESASDVDVCAHEQRYHPPASIILARRSLSIRAS